ncbi:hypothetical protein C8R43DRAFT_874759, partial [Mycena crocata]
MTKEESKTLEDDICRRRTLNKEQQRAFRIVAQHASSPDNKTPLKMYLGGMGGSGKSAVFKAIKEFFALRNEEYRYIVLGPTGSTAALLNGSTYHSVTKMMSTGCQRCHCDGQRNERIQGVEYVLLDEISMVSCTDLQSLASQAAKARNI